MDKIKISLYKKENIIGKVFSGNKAATKIMEDYLDKFRKLFGKNILLGTFNIELEKEIDTSGWSYIEGFTKKDGTKRGGVYYKRGALNGVDVIFLRPVLSRHPLNVIEAISDIKLRDTLKIKDGDRVEISLE